MKKKKTAGSWNGFSAAVLALLAIAEILVIFQLWRLQMLPGKYLAMIAAALLLVTGLISTMLFQPRGGKWQKKTRHAKQVIAYILSLILIAGCSAGLYVLFQLNDTMSAITPSNTVSTLMDVYVRSEDPAQSVADARNYVFGIAQSNDEEINNAVIASIEEELGTSITTQSFETVFTMVDALYAGEIHAIIMDSAYVNILESLDGYTDFSGRVRLIHDHVYQKVIESKSPSLLQPGSDGLASRELDPSTMPFLMYISGNDARMQLLADGGSDVNILAAVNPVTKQVLLVNTPRDYYVENPAGDGARDKLSHCGLNGIENCIGAMTGLYGQPIDYYARINFYGFRTLVDAIGGVTVYSDVAFTAGDTYIQQGENYLNGKQALAFARERKNLPGGDNDRGKNQMKLISAMINQLSAGNLLANYSEILDSLEGMFATSMGAADIGKLVRLQLSEMPSWEIYSFAVTGDNGNDTCWAVGGGYGYVMYPHEHMVAHASELIGKILDGETISDQDLIVE